MDKKPMKKPDSKAKQAPGKARPAGDVKSGAKKPAKKK